MKSRSALRELAEVTESQWGMVTTAQAVARGVSHVNLTRFVEDGDLVRLAHGVYKDAGAPSLEHEALRADWLSVEPGRLAWERLRERPGSATVSGESATVLHGIGNLRAMKSEFTTPKRKQTQRSDVQYRTRQLTGDDVTTRDGIPVTTVERTIADLVEARTPLDHIGQVVRDATRQNGIEIERLEALLAPLAERNGHRKGDGAALFQQILQTVGMDQDSISSQIAAMPGLGSLVASKYHSLFPAVGLTRPSGVVIETPSPSFRNDDIDVQSEIARTLAVQRDIENGAGA